MKTRPAAVALGIATALISASSHADPHRKETRDNHRIDSGLRVIAHRAMAGEPGYRWRYFSDARKGRAVVISPGGDYFYSDGNGLALVFKGSAEPNAG